ncbi:helix-turn-helix domain-containing protein [Agathobaculum sp. LCP25S3_E8]|uniref:helix-turn-helix domain-containing protein n=1 Tax=Agathobaculum sp. LCP25S3_E8 TaxID=3438735 RepID=UPI003F922CF5
MEGDHNRNIMLFLIKSGAMELELKGVPVLAGAGQVVLFDCREPYRYAASDGLEFIWLLFNGLNVRTFYRRILQAHSGRQCFAPDTVTPVTQVLGTFLEGCAADERPSEAVCSQLLHRLLCMLLLGEGERTSDSSDRIAQAIRFMNRHLFEPISVQDVSAEVNLSSSHFSRQFKARTGYSPYEYIVLRRIDKAKYLLTSTKQSVGEIAYATGYNSEENFSHSFQKHVGISPGLFRKYPV